MKYSELIYQGARAAGNYGDPSITYRSFIMGEMQNDPDYAAYIDRAYHEANAFLQRVSALGKVPCKIKTFEPVGVDTAAELVMPNDFLTAVSVFQYDRDDKPNDTQYETLPFKKFGNKVYVMGRYSPYRKIHVQYRPKVPILGKEDIAFVTENSTSNYSIVKARSGISETANNIASALNKAEYYQVDLSSSYGISDEILLLGVDWIRARLKDDVSKGHSEEMEIESRLNDIESDEFIYLQRRGGRNLL